MAAKRDDVTREHIERYELKRVWAVFSGCEGDDPQLFGVFIQEEYAGAVAEMKTDEGDPVVFDAAVLPAIIIGGTLYLANHYEVETHDELEAVLERLSVVGPSCWHCKTLLLPEPTPHCEKCPAPGDCDVEGCKEPGCVR